MPAKNFIDITGQRFGKFVAVKTVREEDGRLSWLCRCDCGSERIMGGDALRRGRRKSCGCTKSAHRMSTSRTYKSWQAMWQRCTNQNYSEYRNYGAKGVTVCEHWKQFENFMSDLGVRPDGKSLDRIDPFGNYEPGNCQWASRQEQNQNTRKRRIKDRDRYPVDMAILGGDPSL